jgi:hypothetical protein
MFRHVLEHVLLIGLLSVVSSEFGNVRENQLSLKSKFDPQANGLGEFGSIEGGNERVGNGPMQPTLTRSRSRQYDLDPSTVTHPNFREDRKSLDLEDSGPASASRDSRDRDRQPLQSNYDREQQATRSSKHASRDEIDSADRSDRMNFQRKAAAISHEMGSERKVTASSSSNVDPAMHETDMDSKWSRAGGKNSQQSEFSTQPRPGSAGNDYEMHPSTSRVRKEPESGYRSIPGAVSDVSTEPISEYKGETDSSKVKMVDSFGKQVDAGRTADAGVGQQAYSRSERSKLSRNSDHEGALTGTGTGALYSRQYDETQRKDEGISDSRSPSRNAWGHTKGDMSSKQSSSQGSAEGFAGVSPSGIGGFGSSGSAGVGPAGVVPAEVGPDPSEVRPAQSRYVLNTEHLMKFCRCLIRTTHSTTVDFRACKPEGKHQVLNPHDFSVFCTSQQRF